jgi:hypothetical protein
MFLNPNIDILAAMPKGLPRVKDMKMSLKKQHAVAALILAISLLSLTPKLTLADQQPQNQASTVIINVSGNATSTSNGPSGATSLNLAGVGSKDVNQDLQLQNMTGSLNIGSVNFRVSDGHGSANSHGNIAIFASVSPNASQLFLHGTMQGNNVTFISPESHLSSIALLTLSGNIKVNGATGNNTSADTIGTSSTVNSLQSSFASQSNSSFMLPGNVTVESLAANSTSAVLVSNRTVIEAITVSTSNSTTLSQSTNQTTIPPALPSQSVTVTVTQFSNHTVSVTQRVANVTVTQTETTTVTNVTITQPNATTTATNSTITTSTSGP